MKVRIHTYGCQMNERDSEALAALLERHGHEIAEDERGADAVVVNTCSVRGKAEEKALGKLGLLAAAKARGGPRIVGAVGCMVQRLGEDIFRRVPGLDFALGTRRQASLPAALDAVCEGRGPVLDVGESRAGDEPALHRARGPAAFVNVLLGCNRCCAYCVVPGVRGREWSRPAGGVIEECAALAAAGVRDITLLGQSVTSYGRANDAWGGGPAGAAPRFTEPFPRLLEALAAIPGLARLRFTSGHPSGCTAELVRAMRELPPVCEHIHLPLQSGADRILGLMRRGYTAADYAAAVTRLRDAVPGIALTTDVIVGFPGETDADFERTRAFMEEIGFDNAFVFKYSPRPGTEAARMPDDVPPAEKLRRNHVLLADQDARGQRINDALVGRSVEVLVEGPSLRDARRWMGRTRTNKIVVFAPSPGAGPGTLLAAAVRRAAPQTLYADPIPAESAEASVGASTAEGGRRACPFDR